MKKTEFQKDGFDIVTTNTEKVYFWSSDAGKYIPMTNDLLKSIISGTIKL